MLAGQSGRLSTWLAVAVLAALAVAALGWFVAEATAQVENAPLRAPAETGTPTVPDPMGVDRTGILPAGKVAVAKPVDEKRMFYALLIVVAVFVIPIVLANYLSKSLRMPDHFTRMAVVLFAILASSAATYFEWPPKLGIDLSGGVILIYEIEQEDFKEMDKLVAAVGRRVNPGGIKEVTVRPYGEREIEIIIPEADEAELQRTRDIVSKQGQLEFRIVADDRYDKQTMDLAREPRFKKPKSLVYDTDKNDPEARWVPVMSDEAGRLAPNPHYATRQTENGQFEALVLIDKYNVTGDYLTTANPDRDEVGKPSVSFGFNDYGASLFGRLTGANLPDPQHADLQRLLAIILDGTLQSAPSIRSRIRDRGQITGSFTEQQVEELAAVLTAGRLPTTLRKEPTTSLKTGATLGQDTIRKGELSMLVSTVAVVVFMLLYYRFAGLVANLALILNVLLIVAFMILFHAAFTLAGLAGLALTVGMAVDANVLIYERMREELARGATLRMAIRNGFERATTTIVDANVTTLISAIVLYWIGTDQVKGFAVTLILGIVMNLFTAITFTRLLFDVAEKQRWITQLKMLHVLQNPNFDFIGKRFAAIALSLLLIGAGLVGVFERGRGLLDIDFTGGVSVEALFEQPQDVADIRERVKDLPDVTVQDIHITGEPVGKRFLIITSKSDIDESQTPATGPKTNIEWVEQELKKAFSDAQHRLAFNHVSWTDVQTVAQVSEKDAAQKKSPDTSSGKKAGTKDEQPSEDDGKQTDSSAADEKQKAPANEASDEKTPGTNDQSRFLPGDENLLAFADDEDAEPAKSDSTDAETAKSENDEATSTKTDAPSDGSHEGKKGDEAQEPAADPFAGGSTTKLTFSETVDH
ncbi:MAG TPA: protein translocase subunit SecD, partial [Pirellulales bacterium]|nr:protein translocase subunit SecD [Pirellulales bacterium]